MRVVYGDVADGLVTSAVSVSTRIRAIRSFTERVKSLVLHTTTLIPYHPATPMSLDQNLFTLHLTPHKEYPNVIDLVDPSGALHYRKQRIAGSEYKIEVYGV